MKEAYLLHITLLQWSKNLVEARFTYLQMKLQKYASKSTMCPFGPPQNQHTFNSHLNYLNLNIWALRLSCFGRWHETIRYWQLSRWGAWPLHEQETIFPYDQRISEVKPLICTPPALSNMERAITIFSAISNEKRDSHTGWICFHLSFALLKKPLLCLSGARSFAIMPRNAALHEPVDF